MVLSYNNSSPPMEIGIVTYDNVVIIMCRTYLYLQVTRSSRGFGYYFNTMNYTTYSLFYLLLIRGKNYIHVLVILFGSLT